LVTEWILLNQSSRLCCLVLKAQQEVNIFSISVYLVYGQASAHTVPAKLVVRAV
jgi:hypothetical protein